MREHRDQGKRENEEVRRVPKRDKGEGGRDKGKGIGR
jgi:hypothetical protein